MSTKIDRDLSKLAPFFRARLDQALERTKPLGIRVFEAMRAPERQDYLYAQGRVNQKPIVTKARAWQSWHQYGLAVDLAFYREKKWTWDGPWNEVLPVFLDLGFESLSFEKSHVQITGKLSTKEAYAIVQTEGLLPLWEKVRLMITNL